MTPRQTHNNGFTLVEVIVVMIVMGILGVIVVSSLSDSGTSLRGQTEALKAHIRYTQSRSMSTDSRVWGLVLNGNYYWLFWCTDPPSGGNSCINSNRATLPGATPDAQNRVDLSADGISISSGRNIISFDSKGRPFVDNNSILQTPLSTPFTITLQDASGNSRTIQLTPETGFLP